MRIADFLSALFSIVILSKKPPFYTPSVVKNMRSFAGRGRRRALFPCKAFLHSAPPYPLPPLRGGGTSALQQTALPFRHILTKGDKSCIVQNLPKIVAHYAGIFSMCDYDPQKIGKNPQSYAQALAGFKMAIAGIL